ncbi:MAG: hypothetical protein H6686_01970 [Fibrobacteria bacterium]|nr:hypothetical protein [Fibrobacteria bacterium]
MAKLQWLAEVLLHAKDDTQALNAFRDTGRLALELFQREELEMERCGCPALAVNRAGHGKFTQTLSNLYAQYIAERSGIRVSRDLRKELLPWIQEHHALVDRQLAHHLRRSQAVLLPRE